MENITEKGNMPLVWKITPVQQAVYNVSTITTPPMSQLLTQTFCHHTLVLGISSFVLFSSCDGAVFPGREPSTAIYPVCLFLCKSKIITGLVYSSGLGRVQFESWRVFLLVLVSSYPLLFHWALLYGFTFYMLIPSNLFDLIQCSQEKYQRNTLKYYYRHMGGVGGSYAMSP